jgi:hypothetical protein
MVASKASGTTPAKKHSMERDQCQDSEHSFCHSVGRHGAAEDRPAYVSGLGSGAFLNTKVETITTREAVVDR